jgi:hypothetical protein
MSGSHHELHIDVPVKLDKVRRDGVGRVELDDFTSVPDPVPRRLIQAEGDDSRPSCHWLSSFA